MYLYIMGRGHSGSTIADMLLGSSPQIETVGELLVGLKRGDDEILSYKQPFDKCPFWRKTRSRVEGAGIGWDEARRCLPSPGMHSLWRIWHASTSDPAQMQRGLVCDLIARAFPDRVVRLRYEDLCAQPVDQLNRVGRALHLDLMDLVRVASGQDPLDVGHNISGNRLRHADAIRFDPAGVRLEADRRAGRHNFT